MIKDGYYFYEGRIVYLMDGDGFEIAQGVSIDEPIKEHKLTVIILDEVLESTDERKTFGAHCGKK